MPTSQMSELIRHLRGAALLRDGAGPTDGQLLEDYLSRRDEAALSALVRRHAPMVWGVCRRVLGNHHDAEDAFQATFLVLVRKASSVRPRGMVSNWLYGVARQTALKARSTVNTRRGRERQVVEMPESAVAEQAEWEDLLPVLDEELSRLPDRHRMAVVLCDLEGQTRKEASRRLGVPEGTVAGWLARGRTTLAKRLTERGVTLSGGALAAVLARSVASAGVPDSVVSATITAASLYAAGRAAGGLISAKAVALTEGVLRVMMVSKLKAVVAVVMVLGFMTTGVAGLVFHKAAARSDKPPVAEERVKEPLKEEKGALTAWGEEVGGLQAGLGLLASQKRVYSHGETITLLVKVRNVGKEAVKFEYLKQFLDENPPAVTDAAGKAVPQHRTDVLGFHIPVKVTLEPGKEVVLETRMHGASGVPYELSPASARSKPTTKASPLFVGAGKVVVQYERVLGDTGSGRISLYPTLSKLGTGKLELEIKADAPTETKGKPVRLRVHVEKVDADARTIAASCMAVGEFDGVHKPLRFENLPVSESAKVVDAGKDIRLADLKPGTGVYLDMEASELALVVIGIEKVGKPKAGADGGSKGGD